MNELAKFVKPLLAILGLTAFTEVEGRKVFKAEEREKLNAYGFQPQFLDRMEAHLNAPEGSQEAPESHQAAVLAAALGSVTTRLDEATAQMNELRAKSTTDAATIAAKQKEIDELNAKIAALSEVAEEDPGKEAGKHAPAPAAVNLDDEAQLFGQAGEMFSLSRPYNQRARAALMARTGRTIAAATASSMDYNSLRDDLGAFYRIPWRERLQSLMAKLPSLETLFPLESGYQDLATLVNVWLGEFSQADNTQGSQFGKVVKGSFEFGHETLRMFGVMFVHEFKDLGWIERSWIGHLNREASNPVKISFIEYLLTEVAKKLQNERELRRVNGIRKNPNPNEPGRALDASDGIYEYLRKRIEGHIDLTPDGGTSGKTVYQIKPFALPRITAGNIGEVFYQGTSMIPAAYRDTGNVVLYIPSHMLPLYHKYNEAHYGTNQDYAANINYVKEYPGVKIAVIPNADNHHRIFWTFEGNIKLYEHKPGEMLDFKLEQVDWTVKVWSTWKEGLAAEAVGKKFTDPADMDGSTQVIWCNDYDFDGTYFVEGPADANPDATTHSSIVTGPNSAPYEITDIKGAPVGKAITIKAGTGGDNGVTIKKAKLFALISGDWKPNKGDTITLMKRADGKFVELNRQVGAADAYQFAADEATPSVQGATVFTTHENTAATAITDLTDAVVGTVYTIHGAGNANASTIADGGNFVLTKAMTLKAGSFIQLVKAQDGKFYEVARREA